MIKEPITTLFPEDELPISPPAAPTAPAKSREKVFNDYEGFVEKFKPRKTTDDCYTPEEIYQTVLGWISENIMPLEGVPVVRPFWPGGDFESFDYPEGCVVIDNPPFSIMSKIRRFYHARGIRYFLFAPALTLANSAKECTATYIICGETITYENGAKVGTSFITNLDCGGCAVWVAGSLAKAIKATDERLRREGTKELPAYVYPIHVASAAILQKIAKAGVELRVPFSECRLITRLDCQRGSNASVYGGGWLFSERAAAKERRYWELSDREKAIVAAMAPSVPLPCGAYPEDSGGDEGGP